MIRFFVPGTPRPQGSKRGFAHKTTGRVILVESAGAPLRDWRGDVKRFAADAQGDAPLLVGPVGVRLVFLLRRPASHPKTKTTWPISRAGDIDKLVRAVLDALTSVCFVDDSQIVRLIAQKVWAAPAASPGCEVTVWGWGEP